jgi:phosphate transport system substrate-binding protein
MRKQNLALAVATSFVLAGAAHAQSARDYISIVGSSTVYPFTTAVAEQFGKANASFKTPKVESTGTGGGFKLFCGGVGVQHPDVSNASRGSKSPRSKTAPRTASRTSSRSTSVSMASWSHPPRRPSRCR